MDAHGPGGIAVPLVHVVESLDTGGLERIVVDLVRGTAGKGYAPELVSLHEAGDLAGELEALGVPVYALRQRDGLDCFLLFRLKAILRRLGARIVHCHNFGPLVYGALAARMSRSCSVVYTAHGVQSAVHPPLRWIHRLGLVDRAVYVSADSRARAIAAAGLSPDHGEVIANGIDVDAFRPVTDRGATRSSLGVPEGAFVFGMVARLSRAKNHADLIRGFETALGEIPSAWLVIVGDGETRGEVEARAAASPAGARIRIAGLRRDIGDVLGAMDVFVLSSHTEGLPVSVLEAMAAGLPAIATRVGGASEVIEDGVSGILVEPGNAAALSSAMVRVARDPAFAQDLAHRGRNRAVEHFSTCAMVEKYKALYHTLSQGSAGTQRTTG